MVTDKTFLVAESDVRLRQTETKLLRMMGYETIHQTASGTQAWSMIKNRGVEVVIAGWELAGLDGLQLLTVLRADPAHRHMPFILVVNKLTKVQVVEAGDAGVSDIIMRPFEAGYFQTRVRLQSEPEKEEAFKEAELLQERGQQLIGRGQLDEALKCFSLILTVHESAEAYYNMGHINAMRERYPQAIQCFHKATMINTSYYEAYQAMAQVYAKMGKSEMAKECQEKAVEVYTQGTLVGQADEVLQEVQKVNPDSINIFNTRGIIYRRQGTPEDAIEQFIKALKVNPNDEHIYYNLARAYLDNGDVERGRKALAMSLKVNPNFKDAKELMVRIGTGD